MSSSWFAVRVAEPGIVVIAEPHHVERVSSYLISGTDRAVLLDTGMGVANIREVVEAWTRLPVTVVNSHAHWDHIGGNALFAHIRIHPAEADALTRGYPQERMWWWFGPESLTGPLPDGCTRETLAIAPSHATGFVDEGNVLDLGGRRLAVLHCPGHSPGGIVLVDRDRGILFSTDVAYDGHLYATRGPDLETYRDSLRRLAAMAPEVRTVYPSHNDTPIAPSRLPLMAEAIDAILAGATPVAVEGERETYLIGEVGVYLFPEGVED
jgi:glyoxylase-like metal-dependent hydrolase (beta-lactamase superfamily II)